MTTQELREALARFPRVPLAEIPTPLHECPRLAAAIGVKRLFLKRDDLTGLAFGGNKTRKFALTFADGVVRLSGELDAASVDELSRLLDAVLGLSPGGLEVSLCGLEFIDAAASRVLASAHRRLDGTGRQLVIRDVRRSAALPLEAFHLQGGGEQ